MKKTYSILLFLAIIPILFSCSQKKKDFMSDFCLGCVYHETKIETRLKTQPIQGEKISFIEDSFTLKVNKQDLIDTLKSYSLMVDEEYSQMFDTAIQYIIGTNVIEYIWKNEDVFGKINWEDFEKMSKEEIKEVEKKLITLNILTESVCPFLESGRFELYNNINNQQIKKYFTDIVSTGYTSSVTGFLTLKKELFWICPPFYHDNPILPLIDN